MTESISKTTNTQAIAALDAASKAQQQHTKPTVWGAKTGWPAAQQIEAALQEEQRDAKAFKKPVPQPRNIFEKTDRTLG